MPFFRISATESVLVHRVTITPRGRSLGVTQFRPMTTGVTSGATICCIAW